VDHKKAHEAQIVDLHQTMVLIPKEEEPNEESSFPPGLLHSMVVTDKATKSPPICFSERLQLHSDLYRIFQIANTL
jgi:hypothetical protein